MEHQLTLSPGVQADYSVLAGDQRKPSSFFGSMSVAISPSGYITSRGETAVAKSESQSVVPTQVFMWAVGLLLAALVGLVGFIGSSINSNLSDIRSEQHNLNEKIDKNHVELIKTIGDVGTQVAVTNQRLYDIADEMHKKK
jgi:hypothetical protein